MPSHSSANPTIQQMNINGHFCYTYKFSIVTNVLGIVRYIPLYNKDFLKTHSEIILEKNLILRTRAKASQIPKR